MRGSARRRNGRTGVVPAGGAHYGVDGETVITRRTAAEEPMSQPVPFPGRDGSAVGRRAVDEDPLMRDLIGATLRRARLEQGRTLREVAEDARVSLPYLSEVERGRKEPSSEVLAAITQALGLRVIDLLDSMRMEVAPAPMAPIPGRAGSMPAGGARASLMLVA
jgi:ribosome-binding protein aMBF1 (putative translation factor)